MSDQEDPAFKVTDRRRFDSDGNERAGAEEQEAHDTDRASVAGDDAPSATEALPTIDFATFILSLSTSAVMHLGQAPHPDGTEKPDLALARQTIDILGMLKEKTTGNLTVEEAKLLDELLYDLRLRYVAARR